MTSPRRISEPRLDRRSLLVRSAAVGAGAVLAASPARSLAGDAPGARRALAAATGESAGSAHPADLSLTRAARLLRSGRLSSRELTEACLERIAERDAGLNGWVRVYAGRALEAADSVDRRRSGHPAAASLLRGVPIGLKDIYAVRGEPLTAGSRILAGNVATSDSEVWKRLRRSGVVLLGHTQTHEFAAGNFTPQSTNPWDRSRTPGGSSGGSAVALAARMVPAATGSDTFGSLRIPAAYCGLTTIKPTLGRIPTGGLIPLARSLDTAGPIARSAKDVALLFEHMTSRRGGVRVGLPRASRGPKPLAGLRVGIPDQFFGGREPAAAITDRFDAFARELQGLGAALIPFVAPRSVADNLSSLDGFRFFLDVPGAEVDRYHRRYFPQRSSEYTQDVITLLTLERAANTPPHDPGPGLRILRDLKASWLEALKRARLDAVLQPASVIEPPDRDSAALMTQSIGDPMVVWNYTGFPAMALPAGLSTATGLPVGVQLVGPPGSDRHLLRIAIDAQRHHPHHRLSPPTRR